MNTPANPVMPGPFSRRSAFEVSAVLVIPAALLIVFTAVQVRFGLNLSDEGFLWYGSQRALAGEVPLRDFMAYEPGRYYWTAAWMWLLGKNGAVATRWAATAFELVAVLLTAFTVWRLERRPLTAIACAACVIVLMYSWHGRYEPAFALLQTVALAWILSEGGAGAFLANGVLFGIAAFFGRNLALYGLVAFAIGCGLLWRIDRNRLTWRRLRAYGAGALIGAAPLLFMVAAVDGYAAALWHSVFRSAELKTTNIMLPIPLPWTVHYAGAAWHTQVALFLLGALFLASMLIGPAALTWALVRPQASNQHPLFLAAAAASVPYAHYVVSRANVEHLSRGGTPLVLAIAILPIVGRGWLRVAAAGALLAALVLVFHVQGPPADRWLSGRKSCTAVPVGADELCLPPRTADIVVRARAVVSAVCGSHGSALIAPYHVSLYPALGLRAPVWEIYALYPEDPRVVADEIARLDAAGTPLAIIFPEPIDGRRELAYDATHPSMTRHLLDRFEFAPPGTLPAPFVAMVRR